MNDFVATGVIIDAKKVSEKTGLFMVKLDHEEEKFQKTVKFTTFKNEVYDYAEQFKDSGERVNIHFNLEESFNSQTNKAYNPCCKAWRIEKVPEKTDTGLL